MRVLSEDKIIVTQTTYGYDDNGAEGLGRFAVKGVKIEVKFDNDVLYEKYKDESFLRGDIFSDDPVERFIDYVFYKEKWCNDHKKAFLKKESDHIQVVNIICLIVAISTLVVVVFKKHIGL